VFISSTFTDLQEERQVALKAILEAGHIPAGMELFASDNKTMLEYIRKWIKQSDMVILMIGNRYGSVEEESGKSYTQLEYEYACELGIPTLAFFFDDAYKFSNKA